MNKTIMAFRVVTPRSSVNIYQSTRCQKTVVSQGSQTHNYIRF